MLPVSSDLLTLLLKHLMKESKLTLVSFNCLLKELFDVGVTGKVLSWFRSYLTCRHHRTVSDGFESSLLPISSGVPQGSILGPLLFIIYINTAPKAIHPSTTVQLYGDDMKCFRIIDNTNDVQQLQSDLSNLNDWSVDHFMKFNSKKCKYLSITRKKNFVDSTYTLNGSQIMSVTTEKDLGVHVSTKLSWNNHIDVTISKANKMLGMIKRTCTNIGIPSSRHYRQPLRIQTRCKTLYGKSNTVDYEA